MLPGFNTFDILNEIEKRGQLVRLVRIAQSAKQTTPDIPFFGGKGGVIERVFGQLFKTKATGKLNGYWEDL